MSRTVRNPLLLPELLYCILDYVEEPEPEDRRNRCIKVNEPSREAQKTFLALALTCKATSEHSLDRLWRSLGSIVPLIRTFGPRVDINRAPRMPPSPDEWAIIHRYAVRVRELCILRGTGAMISLHFLEGILFPGVNTLTPPCLFPNLRVLVWNPTVAYYNLKPIVMKLLLSPGLRSLNFTLRGNVDSPLQFLQLFAEQCPNLKALRWKFEYDVYSRKIFIRTVDVFSRFVLHFKKLENLQFFVPFDRIALKHVILSQNFEVLRIMLASFLPEVRQLDIMPTEIPFPNVEMIKLEIWDFHLLTRLLRPHQQKFRSVVLKYHSGKSQPDAQELRSFFTALATPQRAQTLELFDLRIALELQPREEDQDAEPYVLESDPERYCLAYDTLSPLASFHCLLMLRIELNNQISLDDNELTNLASNWPSLKILCLDCSSGWWPWTLAKYPTLNGLLALIKGCPELWRLRMPIDARNVPMDASSDIRNEWLEHVDFVDSLISDPATVAAFLRKHLPSVERVFPPRLPPVRGEHVAYLRECRHMWIQVATHLCPVNV